ncbi:MAG: hypothetical protein RSE36_04315 [Oscillospiraceae bacterium]
MKKVFVSLVLFAVLFAAPIFSADAFMLPERLSGAYPTAHDELLSLMSKYDRQRKIIIYLEQDSKTAAAGEYTQIYASYKNEAIDWHDITWRITAGSDFAALYYTGELLPFGTGKVTVTATLDDNPAIYGEITLDIVKGDSASKYLEHKQPQPSESAAADSGFEAAIDAFPKSYRSALRELHKKHPSWSFVALDTGISLEEAIAAESRSDRSLIMLRNTNSLLKSKAKGDFDRATNTFVEKDGGFGSAASTAVAYFLDPRNFLDEKGIFQFELLTFDPAFHGLAGVEGILFGSFMENAKTDYLDSAGNAIKGTSTYAETIMSAAEKTNINPYYLASKIRHEIGSTPSPSVSGNYEGMEGYYNFYNIGATDGEGAIGRGLKWAAGDEKYNRPWTSPEKSILGGAQYIGENYIDGGQNTGYLQKFNVNPDSSYEMYHHQYMTNISGSVPQGLSAYEGYFEIGVLDEPMVFSIPVYNDLRSQTSGIPSITSELASTAAFTNKEVVLRAGPSALYDGTAIALDTKVLLKSVKPADSYHFITFLSCPYWYEVELVLDNKNISGFLPADYISLLPTVFLDADETQSLGCFASNGEFIGYLSDNLDVVSVSDDGVVTGVSPGRASIAAYTSGGGFLQFEIRVK